MGYVKLHEKKADKLNYVAGNVIYLNRSLIDGFTSTGEYTTIIMNSGLKVEVFECVDDVLLAIKFQKE